jgi:hypothetical protein
MGLGVNELVTHLEQVRMKSIVDLRERENRIRERRAAGKIGNSHVPVLGCPREIRNRNGAETHWQCYSSDFLSFLRTSLTMGYSRLSFRWRV